MQVTLDVMINKYGSIEGIKRWNTYLENQRKSHSLDGMIEKYGEKIGKEKYQAKKDKMSYVNSKKFYLDKYGPIIGETKYLEWCDKQRKRNALETLVSKYGEKLGTEKYIITNKKKRFGHFYSKKSQELFSDIENKLSLKSSHFQFPKSSHNKGELILSTKNRIYKYDFCDLLAKKIIEFNGDLWHANPDIYKDEKQKILGKKVRHIRIKDKIKFELAKRNGYEILIIWESDYDRSKQDILVKCCDWLQSI